MLHILKRHPIPLAGRFEMAILLTYAFPAPLLTPLLAPGLELDVFDDFAFLAVVTVHTTGLHPAFLPHAASRDYCLTNYRLFTRYRSERGVVIRGLQTLRSDTDSSWLVTWGNRLTRYAYRKADIEFRIADGHLRLAVKTPGSVADLQLTADTTHRPDTLPGGSPFPNIETAERFAGPLPHTLDYEPETRSIIVVEGRRSSWQPKLLAVEIERNAFLQSIAPRHGDPLLAGAFLVRDVQYRWERGRRLPVPRAAQ